jgi:phosphoribosylglycinamide formyltransferase 2
MSSSGKDQSKVDSKAEVEAAWNYAVSGSRVDQGRVIVEGFACFDYEITLLTVRSMNVDSQVETHSCEPIDHVQIHGDYMESWQPQPMPSVASKRARNIASRITSNLGGLGIFSVELFVKNDEVWFIEVSSRHTWFAYQPVNTALRAPGANAVIYGQLEEKDIAFTWDR